MNSQCRNQEREDGEGPTEAQKGMPGAGPHRGQTKPKLIHYSATEERRDEVM